MKKDDWLLIGVCGKAHGIKGGFHFNLESGNDSILKVADEILLKPSSRNSSICADGEIFKIKQITYGHKVMVYLNDISDRNKVDEMLPYEIHVKRSSFPQIADGEFYITDLLGIDVYCHTTGDKIGVIKEYYDNSAQTILVIKGTTNIELPFVDQFFPVVDIENNRIEVLIPEMIE